MPSLYEQRNMHFPPHIWAALERLAAQTNSIARRGPMVNQPSWRVMLERIALGEILLSEREPYPTPASLVEAADRLEAEQRAEYEREAAAQGRDITTPHRKLKRSQLDGDAPKKPRSKLQQLDMFSS